MTLASYRSPKTAVRPSRIVGRGLFADAPIAEGEIVCVKGGHLVTRAEFANLKGVANEAELQIAADLFLTPASTAEFEGLMMFLNHSCDPNVGIQGQIVFVAMRPIAAGEELTLDYATIERPAGPMPCRCGTGSCRRLIASQDWRRPELQRKYGHFFAWYLLEKIRLALSTREMWPADSRHGKLHASVRHADARRQALTACPRADLDRYEIKVATLQVGAVQCFNSWVDVTDARNNEACRLVDLL